MLQRLGFWSLLAVVAALGCWFLLPRVVLRPAVELSVFWCVALVLPGFLWTRRCGGAGGFAVFGWPLTIGLLHLTLLIGGMRLAGLGYRTGEILLPAALIAALLLAPGSHRPKLERKNLLLAAASIALALGVWIALNPRSMHILSDAPAHLGAVRDALAQRAWRPVDVSVSRSSTLVDPRFGLFHGLFGFAAAWTGIDASAVLSSSAIILSPIWILLHLFLFGRFTGFRWLTLALALIYTLQVAAGRAFGLWSVVYPGNIALMFAAGCVAAAIPYFERKETPRSVPVLAAIALGVSCWIHPFAWWGWSVMLVHAMAIMWVGNRSWRVLEHPIRFVLLSTAVGLLIMLPDALGHLRSQPGLHDVPVFVVYLGENLFVADPARLTRWGGGLTVLALPLMAVARRRWLQSFGGAILLAPALAVWTISLNPLANPLVYRLVGYFPERLGVLLYIPVAMAVLLGWAGYGIYASGSRLRRGALGAFALLVLAAFWTDFRQSVGVLRAADARNVAYWGAIQDIASALDEAGAENFVSDPQTSYGVRALRGGPTALYPVAHASPLDLEIVDRLADYRTMLSPVSTDAEWEAAARALRVRYLVVNEHLQSLYGAREYGFVARESDQTRLRQRLESFGGAPLHQGDGWALFDIRELGLVEDRGQGIPDTARRPPAPAYRCTGLEVLSPSVSPGDSLHVLLRLERDTVRARWQAVYLRSESVGASGDGIRRHLGKPIRKIMESLRPMERSRFGGWQIPFAGLQDTRKWPTEGVVERLSIRVPSGTAAGRYRVEVSAHELEWGYTRRIREFFSESDRFSSELSAEFTVQDGGTR
jgi:hypothetical protein